MEKRRPQLSLTPASMDLSVFGQAPIDRLTKAVADFLFPYLERFDAQQPMQLEIEAKFGLLIDKNTDRRLYLPVLNDVVLNEHVPVRFQSCMSLEQHRNFNQMLNKRVELQRDSKEPLSTVTYKHTRETDEFYSAADGSRRYRLTRDNESKQVIDVIEKKKLGDLHIYIPYAPLDCRISVNVEHKVEITPDMMISSSRNKDRLTYKHELFKIDLASVTSQPSPLTTSYELELEIRDVGALAREREKLLAGQMQNDYLGIVQVFLNNIKMLAGKSI